MILSKNQKIFIYSSMSIIYGFVIWFIDIVLFNISKNNLSNNLIGVNITPNVSQTKALYITFFISILYTAKDLYQFSNV
jgi:hypothetical protein